MSYYVEQHKPITGRRRWLRFGYFPYVVFEGTPEQYPTGARVVAVADTRWGARREIRKDRKRGGQRTVREVVERVA